MRATATRSIGACAWPCQTLGVHVGDPGREPTLTAAGPAPSPHAADLLAAGAFIAERYQIVRFLGRGGMGEVYEAHDLMLGERVAIKLLKTGLASVGAIERFLREVQLARRVTHPSVCRLHDVGTDQSRVFLTMELLAGETLADRLARGPIAFADAARIARATGEGLAAAHAVGVVHRDFKPANVMVVGERVVVTDFGLAHGILAGDSTLTADQVVLGTPAYMAPEQVQGRFAGPLADVYAFGVVLFELATGKRPFVGENAAETASKRLVEPAPDPRDSMPDLDERWAVTINRCLQRQPTDRFASMRDALVALGGIEHQRREQAELGSVDPRELANDPERLGVSAVQPRTLRRWWPYIALAVVVVAFALAMFVMIRGSTEIAASTPVAEEARPSIAVVGIDARVPHPDHDWVGAAVVELLAAELRSAEQLRVVSGERVARARLELAAGALDNAQLATLGTRLSARYLVTGDYEVGSDASLELDIRVYDRVRATTLGSHSLAGSEADLGGLADRASDGLRARLLATPVPVDHGRMRASVPREPGALRLYAEGLVLLRRFEFAGARKKLEAAITIEPQFPLAHRALSEALARFGDDLRVRSEAKAAWELAGALPREEKLLVEARYRESIGERQRAIEIYRALHELYPDELEYAIGLAELLPHDEAVALLGQLRATSDDPRIDATEGRVLLMHDLPRSAAAFQRAAAAARARGEKYLLATILLAAYQTHLLAGSDDAAAAADLVEAKAVFQQIGDLPSVGVVNNMEGDALYLRGELRAASERFQEATRLARAGGIENDVVADLASDAFVRTGAGDGDGAALVWAEALELTRRVRPERESQYVLFRATLRALRGELAAAERDARAFGHGGEAWVGEIARLRGDAEGARTALNAGLALDEKSGDRPVATGDEAAVAFQFVTRAYGTKPRIHISLARLELGLGRTAEAATHARQAITTAIELRRPNLESVARATLGAALLADHRAADAQREIDQAMKLGARDEELAHIVWRAIVRARIAGRPTDATLDELVVRARAAKYLALELELELARAELANDRARIATVTRRAAKAGYLSLARRR